MVELIGAFSGASTNLKRFSGEFPPTRKVAYFLYIWVKQNHAKFPGQKQRPYSSISKTPRRKKRQLCSLEDFQEILIFVRILEGIF